MVNTASNTTSGNDKNIDAISELSQGSFSIPKFSLGKDVKSDKDLKVLVKYINQNTGKKKIFTPSIVVNSTRELHKKLSAYKDQIISLVRENFYDGGKDIFPSDNPSIQEFNKGLLKIISDIPKKKPDGKQLAERVDDSYTGEMKEGLSNISEERKRQNSIRKIFDEAKIKYFNNVEIGDISTFDSFLKDVCGFIYDNEIDSKLYKKVFSYIKENPEQIQENLETYIDDFSSAEKIEAFLQSEQDKKKLEYENFVRKSETSYLKHIGVERSDNLEELLDLLHKLAFNKKIDEDLHIKALNYVDNQKDIQDISGNLIEKFSSKTKLSNFLENEEKARNNQLQKLIKDSGFEGDIYAEKNKTLYNFFTQLLNGKIEKDIFQQSLSFIKKHSTIEKDFSDFVIEYEDKEKLSKMLENSYFKIHVEKLNKKGLHNIAELFDEQGVAVEKFNGLFADYERKVSNLLNNAEEESIKELKKIIRKSPQKVEKFLRKNEIKKDSIIDKIYLDAKVGTGTATAFLGTGAFLFLENAALGYTSLATSILAGLWLGYKKVKIHYKKNKKNKKNQGNIDIKNL